MHPYQYVHYIVNNGNMTVLGLIWQMYFGNQFNKGAKTFQNSGYIKGMEK